MRLAALRCEIKSLVHGGLLLFAAGRNRHNVLSGASLAGFVLKDSSGPPTGKSNSTSGGPSRTQSLNHRDCTV